MKRAFLGLKSSMGALLAGALLWSGNAHASVADLKAEAAKQPTSAEAGLALSVKLRRAGLMQEALSTVNKSMGKASDANDTNRLLLERARIDIDRGRMKPAMADCEKLRKADEVLLHICVAETYLLYRRGSLALPEAESALKLKNGDYDATLAKGRALWISGDAGSAKTILNNLVTQVPDRQEAIPHLAELLIGTTASSEAIVVLKHGLQVAPDDAVMRVMLAGLMPPSQESAQLLQEATTLRVDYEQAYAQLGAVLLSLGKLDDAEHALRSALKLNPKDADALASWARVFLLRSDFNGALAQARAALKLMPQNGAAKLVEAQALAGQGEIDLAIEEFQAAYGLQRRNPDVLVQATEACLKHGRPTTAMAFAERATSDFP
ncbi:MAG TPA: tetratricopeptide repeat protein, partial [Polyangiaceae bacterium]|nr:tetratricopeptide repeat protein [Polyangiaceae bacterium]